MLRRCAPMMSASTSASAQVFLLQGEPGFRALSAHVEVVSPNCTFRALETRVGLDTNRDGVLDEGEVTSTQEVCITTIKTPRTIAVANQVELEAALASIACLLTP